LPGTRSWPKDLGRSHWTTENTFLIPERYECWGVRVIGKNAAEIVHIGQAVLRLGATIEYFRDTVFNYPTLAEAYKLAALDGLNKL
jgi:NAD(P) transhydrogenase